MNLMRGKMAKPSRDEFTTKIKRDLAARAGGICSFPGCTQHTSGPSAEAHDASVNLGEASHIRAAASGLGARRYDKSMTSEERRSIDNGIWLCRTHAALIDRDEATYTVEQLHQWKREAEARAEQRLRSGVARVAENLDPVRQASSRPIATRWWSDWKSYLGAVTAATAGLAIVQSFAEDGIESLQWFSMLPTAAKVCVTIVLALTAVTSLFAAFVRRSVLLRPERFHIETERPDQLVGRHDDLRDLIKTCEAHRLVFLPGESGSGKSTLVKVGLVATHKSATATKPRLLPLYIDGSLLEWKGGLARELARELKRLTDEELVDLAATGRPSVENLPQWIASLPADSVRQLLVVIDQFDDYAARWKHHLLDDGLVIDQATLRRKNPDWSKLANGLLEHRLRVLFVCRDDTQWALKTVRFGEAAEKPPLARLTGVSVQPLLDRLADEDERGETVRHPMFGWDQLKRRFLRDLSADGGRVLPVQLVVAVEGLQHLSSLTVAEYERAGGLTGLERLHIKEEIEKAAKCGPETRYIDKLKFLHGLELLLVTENGLKTRPTYLDLLARKVLGPNSDPERLKLAIDYLVSKQILRRRPTTDGVEELMLYHDFLARGLRSAWLRANASHEVLQQRGDELASALTWGQWWRALLSLQEQFRFGCLRLSSGFRYGVHRRLALFSLLRAVPLLLVITAAGTGAWQWSLEQERRAGEACLAIGAEDIPLPEEVRKWTELAGLSPRARLHALRFGLEQQPTNIRRRMTWILHAIVGLDPGGRLQKQIRDEILVPILQRSPIFGSREYACLHLLRAMPPARRTVETLLERTGKEQDGTVVSDLVSALASISTELEAADKRLVATALIERIRVEGRVEGRGLVLCELIFALVSISTELEAADQRRLAAALVERIKVEENTIVLSRLISVLASINTKLEATEQGLVAAALVERIKVEENRVVLFNLSSALVEIATKLKARDARSFAAVLLERMEVEKDKAMLSELSVALAGIGTNLGDEDLRPIAAALLEQMKFEENDYLHPGMASALGVLSSKLEDEDLQSFAPAFVEWMKVEASSMIGKPISALRLINTRLEAEDLRAIAGALVERIKVAEDYPELSHIYFALAEISTGLEAKGLGAIAEALVERIKVTEDSFELFRINFILEEISTGLKAEDLRATAGALVEKINVAEDFLVHGALNSALAKIGTRLKAEDLGAIARTLVDRIKVEETRVAIVNLKFVLPAISTRLKAKNLRSLAEAVVERIRVEKNPGALFELGSALAEISSRLKADDLRPVAAAFVERIIEEDSRRVLSELGSALRAISTKLEAQDMRRGAAVLVRRMTVEKSSSVLAELGSALGAISTKLEAQDLRPGAAALVERMKVEENPESFEGLVSAWLALDKCLASSKSARMQRSLDILQLPHAVLARSELLQNIDLPEKVESLWELMLWIETSEEGQSLDLELYFRPR